MKSRIIILALAATSLALSACAPGTKNITSEDRNQLKTVEAVYTVYTDKSFFALTGSDAIGGAALFGGLGAGIMAVSNGKAWLKDYSVPEPLHDVRSTLIKRVKKNFDIKKVYGRNTPHDKKELAIEALQNKYKKGVVLKLKPLSWGMVYYVSSLSKYHMNYSAHAQIIRMRDGAIVWEGKCVTEKDDKATAPTYAQLKANNAKLFKSWMRDVAKECGNQLADSILKGV